MIANGKHRDISVGQAVWYARGLHIVIGRPLPARPAGEEVRQLRPPITSFVEPRRLVRQVKKFAG